MNDTDFTQSWALLEPDVQRRARIETRLLDWLEASKTSLAGEWLGLLKVEPLKGLAFASVGTVALALLTPVGWILSALL